ncbi:penicillin-binding protein [Sphingomonas koreensis]|jgi:penicillin-binding protein 1A|uniref:Penicillin-binding protein 1A n=1 Tax=Sphingomonas koreensis TaxID=93064 RepID=A0A1L6J5N6_9SPHN|nr:transglycosylase domain-containing protein [Sphingomonas koreensis]APR51229.1 penicillin-binding protein [Sphingomonas koreensis]MDC7810450.1 transglycosylase domain-containing protein [Sphingomonas koreensis]RSU17483.1 penicillin-binding protein [Sphingomonas koreensis]RSU19975.1 penicillin-binding protein [Sphingomonas koreensis]RSU26141.1 penicillin-binding protein [Sphingomonas koreensis]
MAEATEPNFTLKLTRGNAGGRFAALRRRWWFKVLAWLALLSGIGTAALWALFLRDLPSVDMLRSYEPPLPTNVRQGDGTPLRSYARERRVELSYDEYPKLLIGAFLSAEDKTFFDHGGVDYPGLVRAAWQGLTSGETPRGTSTITQQVAKNLLLNNEVSYVRKAREAILAFRIENTLSKEQILELYLNQIALGRNAFGVEAAAHAYFDKDLSQLSLPQFAYLAILPKGPSNYMPERHADRAIERRNWVLGQMLANGYIDQAAHDAAVAAPLGAVPRKSPTVDPLGGYFIEEVRRQLLDRFGETEKAGPYSVYAGGLWVRTSFDPEIQKAAQKALRDGLLRYDRGRGWSGPMREAAFEGDSWRAALLNTNINLDYEDWRAAIVISKSGGSAELGFGDGRTGTLPASGAQMPVRGQGGTAFNALKPGDVIAVAPEGGVFALRSIPKVSGGMIVQDPSTGRVLAMQGGFDATVQAFNRATQAQRQPGSTIKPIVYSAALENGMTPASIIVDGPFCVYQGAGLGNKCFRNFGGTRGAGPKTMRWGIEQSRNLMTVQAANTTGMEKVVDLMQRMGVSSQKYPPYLSYSLGAGETTVMRMVNAYSILVNHGRALTPSLVDFAQDRKGKVIWPQNWRACDRCNMPDWDGKPMPRPVIRSRQVVDAMTAYQMVHITEGVIQRGTATILRDLNRPIMGKTGTSNGPRDVWFIGGTPQMIAGLYLGYDTPTNLGGYAQGGTLAAPIFKQFAQKAYEGLDVLPFTAPAGIRMVRIDRASGRRVYGAWPGADPKAAVIWEAFKPESEPRRRARRSDEAEAPKAEATRKAVQRDGPRDSDFLQREGGIY